MNGAFYHAIELLSLGLAVAVEFVGPLVLAAVLSRQRIDALWITLAATGMALIRIEKAFGAEHISPLGLIFALIAAFFWACYILANARVAQLLDGAGGLGTALVVATLITLPFGGSGAVQAFANPGVLALAQFPQELHQFIGAQGGRRVRPGTHQVGRGVLGEGHMGAHQNKVARMAAAQHGGISQTPDVLKDL